MCISWIPHCCILLLLLPLLRSPRLLLNAALAISVRGCFLVLPRAEEEQSGRRLAFNPDAVLYYQMLHNFPSCWNWMLLHTEQNRTGQDTEVPKSFIYSIHTHIILLVCLSQQQPPQYEHTHRRPYNSLAHHHPFGKSTAQRPRRGFHFDQSGTSEQTDWRWYGNYSSMRCSALLTHHEAQQILPHPSLSHWSVVVPCSDPA